LYIHLFVGISWKVQTHYLLFSLHCRVEAEVIEDVVKEILNKLSYTLFIDTKELVGITSKVEN